MSLFPPIIQHALIKEIIRVQKLFKPRKIEITLPVNSLALLEMHKKIFLENLKTIPEIRDYFDISVQDYGKIKKQKWYKADPSGPEITLTKK